MLRTRQDKRTLCITTGIMRDQKVKNEEVQDINLVVPIKSFAIFVVSMPGVALAVCFITAFMYRFDDVNETMCEVMFIHYIYIDGTV